MQKILVAVNGSKHSEKAADFAADLAKELSAKIILIFVMPRPDVPEDYADYAKREILANPVASYLNTVSEGIIAKLGARLEKKGVEFEAIYHLGNPVEKILETARARKVGLVVVGMHGRRRLGRLRALGSVSRKIIDESPVPVLVVP
ncbi:MAG: universal stress protein [Nitrososphaerota archaeon]|nr:universal stress protein [Nitrososphaerota archaeon]